MKFAIIAAGEGSRLQQEGIHLPKPLVKLRGESLIDRLIRIFNCNGADEIDIIVNQIYPETAQHIQALMETEKGKNIRLIVKNTPSSMHSFYELSELIGDEPFCLTTVDTIFDEQEFSDYIQAFKENATYDGMMAVTDFIDDEKPLYVATDENLNITGFHDQNEGDIYISGGIYCLNPVALNTLRGCIAREESRMRNFQRALITDGLHLKACLFSKILDVDHASDIQKAVDFLESHQ